MKLIFFGTPPFAAHVLEYLLLSGCEIAAVVSKPDRPQGRSASLIPTAVKQLVNRLAPHLPLHQPERASSPDFIAQLHTYHADLFVVVAYGEILSTPLLALPQRACLNLHASLLPHYRGAAPIQRCVIEGQIETGVTIMHMVRQMDAGDVIVQEAVPIEPDMTYGELETILCEVGKKNLLKVIQAFEEGSPPRHPQEHAHATFAPKIELEECQLHWKRSAIDLHNLVRGVNPQPGAWCWVWVKGVPKRLKVHRTRLLSEEYDRSAGEVIKRQGLGGNLCIATGAGGLELVEVQLEGKRAMSSAEWVRGFSPAQLSFQDPQE